MSSTENNGFLSLRTEVALRPLLPYFQSVLKAEKDLWSPDNEEGNLIYCIAENQQTVGMIRDKLSSVGSDVPNWCLAYNDMKGIPQLRKALVSYLKNTFMKGVDDLDEQQLVVSNGCGTILDSLFYCIAEKGEGVIIPTPYYPVFDIDMSIKAGLVPRPAHLNFNSPDLPEQLDVQIQDAKKQGIKISVVLLTHPNNPLGTIYTEQNLLTLLKYCAKNKIHLISDEIYANSIFNEDSKSKFQSMAQILQKFSKQLEQEEILIDCKNLLHVVFGFSKDWCASGLRVGCLRTQNDTLLRALESISYFGSIPVIIQYQLAKILSDLQFVEEFLKKNNAALKDLYTELTGCLKEVNIPFVGAVSGMFVWIDLRQILSENSWQAEEELYYKLVDNYKIVFTPGQYCHAKEPGFFRLCYAQLPRTALPFLFKRLKQLMQNSLENGTN